ncbi:MAG: DUF3516 domain-containing protein [Thermoanaerobaculia bacterium]|nr:DUF3516 domain-containing protein [Thermoanaerobaculia bacterium]
MAPTLGERVPPHGTRDPDEILDLFLGWVADVGFELYPAQEEALLEIAAGRHVVLQTPTGSGKSLVAQGVHFRAVCEGRISYYTSPIKALASEKFFDLCDEFGAERVGMLTGDAAINPGAPIVCCTAEVLSNRVLREPDPDIPYVVMDEFHYYSDPERGVAWQVPLLKLPRTRFLLMSATLGDTRTIERHLEERTEHRVAAVTSSERPVPLDYDYRETPITRTIEELVEEGRAPVYVVNFTQRECAELAQGLSSLKVSTREERDRIREEIGGFRFDTPYGKKLRRLLGFGIGVHHAGLLPKYRLLVEQLSQKGLLKAICGTDTLGVGVNIPIRTVLFSKLAKYDGRKVGILSVRDFQQIAGRAGRRGFDEKGSVVCQAPESEIEKKKRLAKGKKPPTKSRREEIRWTRETFEKLVASPPETLESRFRVDQGMILSLLQSEAQANDPDRDNFDSLRELIAACHEPEGRKPALLSQAARLVRSLSRVGLIEMTRDTGTGYYWVTLNEELQREFAMHQPLSLYLVETLESLAPEEPEYALDVLSVVESILENPRPVLLAQRDRARTELIQRLKAEGVPYEERMERLEEVTWPRPNLEFAWESFDRFRDRHPWVMGENVRPKSVGREIFEGYLSFNDYVRRYGLRRSEGVLLRYLSQLYKTLRQNVPEAAKTDELYDIEGFFRTLLERTDTSLLEEWESLLHPDLQSREAEKRERARRELRTWELFHDPRAFTARVRSELHQIVRSLARGDYEDTAAALASDPHDRWDAERLEEALAPFLEAHRALRFDGEARLADKTRIDKLAPRLWRVRQNLLDPEGESLWHLEGEIDLTAEQAPEGPLVRLRRIAETG